MVMRGEVRGWTVELKAGWRKGGLLLERRAPWDGAVKLWLQPVRVAYTCCLMPAQVRRIRELTFEHQTAFVERWNEFFGG